jgi:hypothetical protein
MRQQGEEVVKKAVSLSAQTDRPQRDGHTRRGLMS